MPHLWVKFQKIINRKFGILAEKRVRKTLATIFIDTVTFMNSKQLD